MPWWGWKSQICGAKDRLEIQVNGVMLHSLESEGWEPGRLSVLGFGGRIPSCLRNLSLCSLVLQMTGRGPPTLWRAVCFSPSPLMKYESLLKRTPTVTWRLLFDQLDAVMELN